ncbi:MAG TPA: choice-of-anchor D domain-containing protein [Candidatus Kapabacteria bacterium]|nr:choice-of-anchor D domain-containing protein [Candidatus Kapabacteria bacterium]
MKQLFRLIWGIFAITGLFFLTSGSSHAQGARGIDSYGRDFYLGYMPAGGEVGNPINGTGSNAYILICSLTNDNTVTVSYFGSDGKEIGGTTHIVQQDRCLQMQIPSGMMTPAMPGETPQYKAAHIVSNYPVTVQFYMEGSNSGGLYMGIPTSALGTHYVTACYFDNPLQDNPSPAPFRDSTSSEFMIIAAYDNTNIVFTPNATTKSGVIGKNSGDGSNGTSHPVHIQLARGQVYWVRSQADNSLNDLTGSDIVSDKPIAVLGGQERGLLGLPGAGISTGQDVRDVMVEEMTPVDSWDSEFVSIPFLPPSESNVTGVGDLYRVLSDNTNAGNMDGWIGAGATFPRTEPVSAFQTPAAQWENVTDAIDLIVSSKDKDGMRKKMYPVMYDYFQDNGAPDDYAYTTPNEQNVVALARFENVAVFKVPQNSYYHGFQFINIITTKDSLRNIRISYNGGPGTPLSSYPKLASYQIPLHPELTGITSRVASGDYFIYGNTPFVCYSYGRTEDVTSTGAWGYAAPCGMLYGARTLEPKPRTSITRECDRWSVRVTDILPGDQGIADVELLNDPNGIFTRPPHVSYNASIFPNPPQFIPGDTSVSFDVIINDVTRDSYAAILVTDRSGNDTIIELRSIAIEYTLSSTKDSMLKVDAGAQACSTFSMVVQQTGSSDTITVYPPHFAYGDKSFSVLSNPSLPKVMHAGDSVQFTVCFNSVDTFAHRDSLVIPLGCLATNYLVRASGVTPIIIASDYDFGNVAVGDTVCHSITIQNTGNGTLIIDKNWVLQNVSSEFSFGDDALLPDTIPPGGSANFVFCFHPTVSGGATAQMNWSTNLVSPFRHQLKDTSLLQGNGVVSSVAETSTSAFGIDALQPNPAQSDIALHFRASGPTAQIEIFDVLGRQVRAARMSVAPTDENETRFDLRGLLKGSYILRLTSGGRTASARFEIE